VSLASKVRDHAIRESLAVLGKNVDVWQNTVPVELETGWQKLVYGHAAIQQTLLRFEIGSEFLKEGVVFLVVALVYLRGLSLRNFLQSCHLLV
jgi:hypothetical protein